jgi:hypothetical protein
MPKLVQSKQKKANNYFVAFADPAKQAKYRSVADIGAAYKQLIGMVNGYVNYYVKNSAGGDGQNQKNNPQQPAQKPQSNFQGFQTNDPRTWQQRQQHLNSIGIDTTGWKRQEIMRGAK